MVAAGKRCRLVTGSKGLSTVWDNSKGIVERKGAGSRFELPSLEKSWKPGDTEMMR